MKWVRMNTKRKKDAYEVYRFLAVSNEQFELHDIDLFDYS